MTATLHTAGQMGFPVVDFTHIEQAAVTAARTLKNVALFVAAPFIGLVYALALPLVGVAMLAMIAKRAFMASKTAKNVALTLAAPVIGLVFAVTLPLIGLFMIAKVAIQAYRPVEAV